MRNSNPDIQAHDAIHQFLKGDSPFRKELYSKLMPDDAKLLKTICFSPKKKGVELASMLTWNQSRVSRRIDNLCEAFAQLAQTYHLPYINVEQTGRGKERGFILHFNDNSPAGIRRRIEALRGFGRDEAQYDIELLMVLDGITYTRVGELVIDDHQTQEARFSQARAYQKSLQDFAFAGLMCDSLGVDQRYWPIVDTEVMYPTARTVLNKIVSVCGREALTTVGRRLDPEFFMENALRRQLIAEDMRRLAYVDWAPWDRLIRREASENIGSHATLYQEYEDYSKYKFVQPYVFNDELSQSIPDACVSKGQATVSSLRSDITVNACRAFVARVLLTHVSIGLCYALVSEARTHHPKYQDYLPCETRASLIVAPERDSLARQQRRIARIQRLLLPYCLTRVVRACQHRDAFVETVFDLRETSEIEYARKKLRQIREEIARKNSRAVETLTREINRAAVQSRDPSILEQWVEVFDECPNRARWAQELVAGINEDELLNIQAGLSRLFPETYAVRGSN